MNPRNLRSTVKHGGGNVLVWGCMAASGVGNLHFIEGAMNKFMYRDILTGNLEESAGNLGLAGDYYFQQDNDPKHTSHLMREWLLYHVPHQLKTPPQSPDLNPIENLWEHLDRQIRKHNIQNKNQLKAILREEWQNISSDITENLVNSIPRRLQAVVEAKGFPTKY